MLGRGILQRDSKQYLLCINNAQEANETILALFHWPKLQTIMKDGNSKIMSYGERKQEKPNTTACALNQKSASANLEFQPVVVEDLELLYERRSNFW